MCMFPPGDIEMPWWWAVGVVVFIVIPQLVFAAVFIIKLVR